MISALKQGEFIFLSALYLCVFVLLNGMKIFLCSFVTEPMSIGLNIGFDMVNHKSEPKDTLVEELHDPFGVKNTVVSHHLSRGFLKGLKYSDDSYTVSLLPV